MRVSMPIKKPIDIFTCLQRLIVRAWTSCGNTVLRQTTAAKDMKSSTDLRVDTQQMSWVTTRVGVVVTKDCLSDSDI